MVYRTRVLRHLFILLSILYVGCAEESKDVVAKVGDHRITAEQLKAYIDNLPEEARSDKAELDESRDHLLTMIDMELMQLEAKSLGIDKSPGYLKRLRKRKRTKLVEIYLQRNIEITAEESDFLEYVKEKGHQRSLRLADIMVADQQKAAAVAKALKEGENFAQVARKWSINEKTAPQGGDMGKFSSREQMIKPLQDQLFALAVGEVSGPVQLGGRYVFFKVLDEAQIQLHPQQQMKIQREFERLQFKRAKAAIVAQLKTEYHLSLEPSGFDQLLEDLDRSAAFTTPNERNTILYSFDHGKITAGDFVDVASETKGNPLAQLADSQQAQVFAEDHLLPDQLIMAAALQAGLDREEKLAKWLVDQQKQLLMMALRENLLKTKVAISEKEVKQYYDTHPEKYLHPEHTEIQEILVATESEAIRLLEEAGRGAPLGDLVKAHSIRPMDVRDEEGKFHIHSYEVQQFGDLIKTAKGAEIGSLNGPVALREGYSIFKVLSRGRKRETFEEASFRVRSHVRRERFRQEFNQFIEDLRLDYQSDIEIRDKNLKAAFSTG